MKISLFKSEKEVEPPIGDETQTTADEHTSKSDNASPFLVKQSVPEEGILFKVSEHKN